MLYNDGYVKNFNKVSNINKIKDDIARRLERFSSSCSNIGSSIRTKLGKSETDSNPLSKREKAVQRVSKVKDFDDLYEVIKEILDEATEEDFGLDKVEPSLKDKVDISYETFINRCINLVRDYYRGTENRVNTSDVYVVWYCKTLQNHKALLSTKISDCMYFEITYNGDKGEFYFDAYKKQVNKCIPL